MNTKVAVRKEAMPALAMSEDEMINVLGNSLYPGAQVNSIKLVIGYCKAAGLDPIQKPVHIVPMWDSKLGAMRDIIMPGIGSYRTQAARSGEYAGVSEPEFGGDLTENIGGVSVTYPLTCRVVVKRLLSNGAIAEFAATERWKENYAVKGGKEKSVAPNTMWKKRPYAQLAKCAEAQALRKAFPEFSGAQPTADEMEGKALDDVAEGEITKEKIIQPQSKSSTAKPKTPENVDTSTGEVVDGISTVMAEAGEVAYINNKIAALKETNLEDLLQEVGLTTLDNLSKDGFIALRDALKGKK